MYHMTLVSPEKTLFAGLDMINQQLALMFNSADYRAGWQHCNEAKIDYYSQQQQLQASLQLVLNAKVPAKPSIALAYFSYLDGAPDQAFVSKIDPDTLNMFIDTLDQLHIRAGACMEFALAEKVVQAFLKDPEHIAHDIQWEDLTELDSYLA